MDDDLVGEFELLRRLQPFLAGDGEGVLVGSGDDAAVLDMRAGGGRGGVLVAVDVVVDGVHFRRDVSSMTDVGWKAVAVNVSDIAAMGGAPTAAVIGLCKPADVPGRDIEALYAGMDEACKEWGLRMVGGDTVDAGALALAVTVIGTEPPTGAVRRSGARPDDRVVIVGSIGAAAAALALRSAGHDAPEVLLDAHRRPRALPRAGAALAEAGATSMIDVSDGLGADLVHIAEASGVHIEVEAAALPIADGVAEAAERLGVDPLRIAAGGGEDFALLATLPASAAEAGARAAGEAAGVPYAVIGRTRPTGDGPPVILRTPDGTRIDATAWGYEHHRRAPDPESP